IGAGSAVKSPGGVSIEEVATYVIHGSCLLAAVRITIVATSLFLVRVFFFAPFRAITAKPRSKVAGQPWRFPQRSLRPAPVYRAGRGLPEIRFRSLYRRCPRLECAAPDGTASGARISRYFRLRGRRLDSC